jgi:hypothetical protein
VVLVTGVRAVFLYGFAKNERSSISEKEKKAYRKAARVLAELDNAAFEGWVKRGDFAEVERDG